MSPIWSLSSLKSRDSPRPLCIKIQREFQLLDAVLDEARRRVDEDGGALGELHGLPHIVLDGVREAWAVRVIEKREKAPLEGVRSFLSSFFRSRKLKTPTTGAALSRDSRERERKRERERESRASLSLRERARARFEVLEKARLERWSASSPHREGPHPPSR